MHPIKTLIAIGVSSAVGGMLRYLISLYIQHKHSSDFPLGTLVVNLTGCFLIGLLIACYEKSIVSEDWRLFCATGILGGFTTYSAFSLETVSMFRQGNITGAILYLLLSIVLGLVFTLLGFYVVKLVG